MGCVQCAVLRGYSKDYEASNSAEGAAAAKTYIKKVFSQCHERRTTDPNYSFMLLGVGTGATCWTHPDFVDAAFMQELGDAAGVSVGA